ncbi:MAG TPA: SMC-Scp complex subunit ScpB [Syntrophorhabdaceae bacterium]|nr:SMC-Scp complex subunit ScpB [Syntrophorhabdaceae bacterium]
MELKRIIEAILFVSPRPVSFKGLFKKIEGCSIKDVEKALNELIREYNYSDRAIEVVQVSGGFQMRTRVEFKDWIRRFVREKDVELTKSVLETLATIAYKQPVTKKEVDAIRGVDSSRAIKNLLNKRLVEIAGRDDEIGKAITFRTTGKFLEVYGLNSIEDLPTLRELETI